jgi:hypothetical protein
MFLTDFRKIFKYQNFSKNHNVLDRFSKNIHISKFRENCSQRTDGQTGRPDEANSSSSQFCERA